MTMSYDFGVFGTIVILLLVGLGVIVAAFFVAIARNAREDVLEDSDTDIEA